MEETQKRKVFLLLGKGKLGKSSVGKHILNCPYLVISDEADHGTKTVTFYETTDGNLVIDTIGTQNNDLEFRNPIYYHSDGTSEEIPMELQATVTSGNSIAFTQLCALMLDKIGKEPVHKIDCLLYFFQHFPATNLPTVEADFLRQLKCSGKRNAIFIARKSEPSNVMRFASIRNNTLVDFKDNSIIGMFLNTQETMESYLSAWDENLEMRTQKESEVHGWTNAEKSKNMDYVGGPDLFRPIFFEAMNNAEPLNINGSSVLSKCNQCGIELPTELAKLIVPYCHPGFSQMDHKYEFYHACDTGKETNIHPNLGHNSETQQKHTGNKHEPTHFGGQIKSHQCECIEIKNHQIKNLEEYKRDETFDVEREIYIKLQTCENCDYKWKFVEEKVTITNSERIIDPSETFYHINGKKTDGIAEFPKADGLKCWNNWSCRKDYCTTRYSCCGGLLNSIGCFTGIKF